MPAMPPTLAKFLFAINGLTIVVIVVSYFYAFRTVNYEALDFWTIAALIIPLFFLLSPFSVMLGNLRERDSERFESQSLLVQFLFMALTVLGAIRLLNGNPLGYFGSIGLALGPVALLNIVALLRLKSFLG